MAISALTVNQVDVDGMDIGLSAANVDGHTIDNDGENTFLLVENGDASPHTLTFATPFTIGGVAIAEHAVTVPAGETWIVGPFPVRAFSRTLTVTFDAVTSVTVGAFRL